MKYVCQNNNGPGAARNNGVKNSNGDLIVFIDSDCEADGNWLKIIYDYYKENKFDAFGGPDHSKEEYLPIQIAIDFSRTSFFTTGGMRGHNKKMLSKFYPRSHNMGVKKTLFENIGGFGSLRHGQDIELSNRIYNSGAKVLLLTDAIVFHRRRTTLKKFSTISSNSNGLLLLLYVKYVMIYSLNYLIFFNIFYTFLLLTLHFFCTASFFIYNH